MKRIVVLFCCAALLAVVGCGEKEMTPEEFGKKYIEKKFANEDVDLLKLDYNVVETDENTATVVIEGTIKYREEISLVKKGDEWVIADKAPEAVEEAVVEEEAEAAPVEEVEEPVAEEVKPDEVAEEAVNEEAVHSDEVEKEAHEGAGHVDESDHAAESEETDAEHHESPENSAHH